MQITKLYNYPKNKKRAQKVQKNWNTIRNIHSQWNIWVKHRNYSQETTLGKHMYAIWTFTKSIEASISDFTFCIEHLDKVSTFQESEGKEVKCREDRAQKLGTPAVQSHK